MISLAKRLAQERSQHRCFHHSAIVLRAGAPIATGWNHGWVHAEISALNRLWPSERRGTKMLSIRVTRGGKLANARPCEACWQYMRESGVNTVYFSTTAGDIQMERIR